VKFVSVKKQGGKGHGVGKGEVKVRATRCWSVSATPPNCPVSGPVVLHSCVALELAGPRRRAGRGGAGGAVISSRLLVMVTGMRVTEPGGSGVAVEDRVAGVAVPEGVTPGVPLREAIWVGVPLREATWVGVPLREETWVGEPLRAAS